MTLYILVVELSACKSYEDVLKEDLTLVNFQHPVLCEFYFSS